MKRPADDRSVDRMVPAEQGDYLDKRNVKYAKPLVLADGTSVDLNEPGPLSK